MLGPVFGQQKKVLVPWMAALSLRLVGEESVAVHCCQALQQ